ncbi:MAG: dephospho-CoA kinase [Dokdonia sp.]|jgi:dephospho-CoA kinase
MIVGLTGGIGAGKTTVAQFFETLGIAVYIADQHAKALMVGNPSLKKSIVDLLGSEAYTGRSLNRSFIASKIFNDHTLREQMNALVHPVVGEHFLQWKKSQKSPYVIKEAAILFENGSYLQNDYNIVVTAPIALRIQRVMKRDKVSEAQVKSRINAQWSDAKKMAYADAHIHNEVLATTKKAVLRIHQHLLKRIEQNW